MEPFLLVVPVSNPVWTSWTSACQAGASTVWYNWCGRHRLMCQRWWCATVERGLLLSLVRVLPTEGHMHNVCMCFLQLGALLLREAVLSSVGMLRYWRIQAWCLHLCPSVGSTATEEMAVVSGSFPLLKDACANKARAFFSLECSCWAEACILLSRRDVRTCTLPIWSHMPFLRKGMWLWKFVEPCATPAHVQNILEISWACASEGGDTPGSHTRECGTWQHICARPNFH